MPSSRRQFLRLGGASVALALAGCSDDQTPQADKALTSVPSETPTASGNLPETVRIRRLAHGLSSPIGFETVPGRPGEWVVVDQEGRAWQYDDQQGAIRSDPLLDVREEMVELNDGYDESGLLGMAFHPEFESNGKLYVRYSSPRRSGTPKNYDHTFVLSEFTMDPEGTTVPLDSERTVLEIPEPEGNHNSGTIAFGPEGYLYVSVGDGGGAGDKAMGHVEDWYDANEGGNGQDVEQNLLGSVLRIDVDNQANGKGYAIPADNPLVGKTGLDEIYAWGFRNPWRMSFDQGDLFVADVGQSKYEEVDLVQSGGNYGWNVREGTHCYKADDCPSETPDGTPLRDPIVEYSHSGDMPRGRAVIGGYRYHGSAFPDLQGTYVFADWALKQQLFVARQREDGLWPISMIAITREGTTPVPTYALAFGRTQDGELTICTSNKIGPAGRTGEVYQIVPA
ncbi:MAG: sorbosone dehydrogenase family protein [Halapricum sp.]